MLLLATEWVDDLLAANATTSLEFVEIAGFELLKITGLEFVVEVASNREIISTSDKILAQKRILTWQWNCGRERPMRGEQQWQQQR